MSLTVKTGVSINDLVLLKYCFLRDKGYIIYADGIRRGAYLVVAEINGEVVSSRRCKRGLMGITDRIAKIVNEVYEKETAGGGGEDYIIKFRVGEFTGAKRVLINNATSRDDAIEKYHERYPNYPKLADCKIFLVYLNGVIQWE